MGGEDGNLFFITLCGSSDIVSFKYYKWSLQYLKHLLRNLKSFDLKTWLEHWGFEVNKVYINDNPVLTLTYFTARSNLATHGFELENVTKSFKGKSLQQISKLMEDLCF